MYNETGGLVNKPVSLREKNMSIGVVIWTTCTLSVPADLPSSDSWKNYGRADWAYESTTWQVLVEPTKTKTIPSEIKELNSNISNGLMAVVEPSRTEEAAYKFLNSVAVSVAHKCGGAVLQGPMGVVQLNESGEEI